jgi:formiminotetrahydrofolate cyclodeaminase
MITQQLYDELMEGYLLQTREQIQQDLLTLIDSDDEALNDKMCQIVVDNFAKFFSECANP